MTQGSTPLHTWQRVHRVEHWGSRFLDALSGRAEMRDAMRLVAKTLVITLLGTVMGCVPRVAIPHLKPAPRSLGAAQNLAIDVIGDVAPPSTLREAIGTILNATAV